MDIKQQFGQKVREIRKRQSISQEELAMRIGADQAYISRIESGQMNLTLDSVAELADALGVRAGALFG